MTAPLTVVSVPDDLWLPARAHLAAGGFYLTQVAHGPGQTPRYILTDTTDAPTSSVELSEQQSVVLTLMAEGRTNAQIGRAMGVSEDTVKTHVRRLFAKLGARDRAHIVHLAHQAGLLRGAS